MKVQPYSDFKEWEQDMDKIRAHPNDFHLLQHVRSRVFASSSELQEAVNDYLLDSQFDTNPLAVGQYLANKYGKVLTVKTLEDIWWNS